MENKLQVHYRSKKIMLKNRSLNMSKAKSSKNNIALAGPPFDQTEFEQMIEDAEKGPFHSIQTLKEEILKWKTKYSK